MSASSRLLPPGFEHATVADAMRHGLIACPPDTALRNLAGMMASYHVHAVLVEGGGAAGAGADRPWGIVSDLDLASAVADGRLQASAGELAGSSAVSVAPTESLAHAARLMTEHGVGHLLVSAQESARPVGIISTLDLAVALAWGRG